MLVSCIDLARAVLSVRSNAMLSQSKIGGEITLRGINVSILIACRDVGLN